MPELKKYKMFINGEWLDSDTKKTFETLNPENNNMSNFIKIYSLFVHHEDGERFESIKAKTLVMTGEGDVGSTPEMSKNLSKKFNNSTLKIIPVGKHLCSIECSDDVNNTIKDHILNA